MVKFIFLIGVEGAGHHLMREVLFDFTSAPFVADQDKWHFWCINIWNAHNNQDALIRDTKSLKHCLRFPPNISHAFESASFPFDNPRDTLRRPDIVTLTDTLLERDVEPRYIVLYRNPIAATLSSVRRGFSDSIPLQARIVEDNLNHIQMQLSQYDNCYRSIVFEDLVSNPDEYIVPLADWIGVNTSYIGDIGSKIKPTNKPPEDQGGIKQILTQHKIDNWDKWIQTFSIKDQHVQ